MLHRVALVKTDVSEEISAYFIRVTRIGELGTILAVITTNSRCEEIILKSYIMKYEIMDWIKGFRRFTVGGVL
jgi:hypothetical protein